MAERTAASGRPPYVRLAAADNVVVLTRHVDPGDAIPGTAQETWTMTAHLEAGNKLAAQAIAAGEKVVKVGVPIGTATHAIEAGHHVHSHNLRSDYIPIDLEEAPDGDSSN
jgi:hypothetical protein